MARLSEKEIAFLSPPLEKSVFQRVDAPLFLWPIWGKSSVTAGKSYIMYQKTGPTWKNQKSENPKRSGQKYLGKIGKFFDRNL